MHIHKSVINSPWQIIQNTKAKQQANKIPSSNLQNFVAAQGSIPVTVNSTIMSPNNNKCKHALQLEVTIFCKSKKQKLDHHISTIGPPNIHFSNKKHQLESSEMFENPKPKKKLKPNDIYNGLTIPCGLMWDSQNYSCAYDALFTILFGMKTLKDAKGNLKTSMRF